MKNKVIELSGDKSLSHRALMLSAISKGVSKIGNLCDGLDVLSTISCLRRCGVLIQKKEETYYVISEKFINPSQNLNCGNSGTTIRLLIGLLAGQGISATLYGDESLMKRPMDRIINPLRKMGANIEFKNKKIHLNKSQLIGGNIHNQTSSAQVKSAIIMAALGAINKTNLRESHESRDHTEIMIKQLSQNCLNMAGRNIIVRPSTLKSRYFQLPGDISKASFLIAYACLSATSGVTFKNLLINPSRMGFLSILKKMGANLLIHNKRLFNGELVGNITVEPAGRLKNIQINSSDVINMIDEIPILAVMASFSKGTMIVNGVSELRLKESDRVHSIIYNLNRMRGDARAVNDKIIVRGKKSMYNTSIKTFSDHRIAMSFYIASLLSHGKATFDNLNCINISFPNFFEKIGEIRL